MKQGKRICETLKAIRSEIASANEIDYTPIKCDHDGDCAGTCPACESETRWLERQLRMRHVLGKAVTIAGVSMAMTVAASATTPSSIDMEQMRKEQPTRPLKGKVPMPPANKTEEDTLCNTLNAGSQFVAEGDTIITDDGREVIIQNITTGIVPMKGRLKPNRDSIYTEVDVEATFPDGDKALDSLIKDQLYIPDEILAPIKDVGGTVRARCIVKALIEIDGTISDAVIENSTTAAVFDEEALSVVKNLPKFNPALLYDVPVRSWKLIPVEFFYDFSAIKENE